MPLMSRPTKREAGRPDRGLTRAGELGARRRDRAEVRVRRTSRAVMIVATGAAAVVGLVVSREIPGTTATAATTPSTATSGPGSSSSGSSTSSGASASTSGTAAATTTTTTAPSATSNSATVVSGGTGR
jgi:cytoskeletal protein RodZ